MVALVSTQLLYGIGDGVTQSNLRPSSARRSSATMAGPTRHPLTCRLDRNGTFALLDDPPLDGIQLYADWLG